MESRWLPWKHTSLLAVCLVCLTVTVPAVYGQMPPPPPTTPSRTTTRSMPTAPSASPPAPATTTTTPRRCGETEWKCRNDTVFVQCTSIYYVCDGDNDCADASDEDLALCADFACDETSQFECKANRDASDSKVCIPVSYICDSDPDCMDGADELPSNCPTTTLVVTSPTPPKCDPDVLFECPTAGDIGCIPRELKCDTLHDCKNGEDEEGCVYENCTVGSQFTCRSGQCIDVALKCNGRVDCKDGSDEFPETCEIVVPACEEHEFSCKNGRCLTWYSVLCNGIDDCGDNSDETICSKLHTNECDDEEVSHQCSQNCEERTFGYKCSCNDGYKLDKDGKTCIDIDECSEIPLKCNQICVNSVGSYACSCGYGYRSEGSSQTCKRIDDTEPYLMFANKYAIRKMNFNGTSLSKLSGEHTYTHVLDYDYREKMIYYADAPNMKQVIKRMNFDGSGKEIIERHHVLGIEGIAVDWVGNNLYWTSNKQRGLFVSRKDGSYVKVLLHDGSKQPRALALYPKTGYLFWTDWSLEPFIARIGMDGSRMKKVVTTGIFWPNGLTIDYTTERLWWVDAHIDQLESCNLDGSNRQVVMTNLPHPYALTIFEDFVFWTEWNLLKIEKANRFLAANRTTIRTTLQMPYDIHVVHSIRQPEVNNPCGTNLGGCSHLCLLSPAPAGGGDITYTCACPEHYIMGDDGKTCSMNCSSGHFVCPPPGDKCIPARFQCNGQNDCQGGEDEAGCPPPGCDQGYFPCDNSSQPQCIPNWKICDGSQNCINGADEAEDICADFQCMSYEFRCQSGQCIPLSWECDGDNDCTDASDEQPLNVECTKCNDPDQFKCDNGKCIPLLWRCDWDDDCGDLSDEPRDTCYKERQNNPCLEGWTHCDNNYRCIPSTNLCDGNDDCRDNSDESPSKCPTCPRGDFQCTNGTPSCIPERWKCDFRNDCEDGSDENTATCQYRDCSDAEFRCQNQKCIEQSQKCDGIDNCQDGGLGSDERGCPKIGCSAYEYQCTNEKQCLSYDLVCDNIIHCDDASDETHCGTRAPGKQCLPEQFACANKACVPMTFVCDGENDCRDWSDEFRDACMGISCQAPESFRCTTTHKCIKSYFKCNGFDDCGDNSDEADCETKCYTQTQFTCPDGSCISLRSVCDGNNDCQDRIRNTNLASDEIGCIRSQYCTDTSCMQRCVNVTFQSQPYHKCECNPGYVHADHSGVECVDLDECASISTNFCPHSCTNQKGTFKCSCAEGFSDGNSFGHMCNPRDPKPISMLYSIGHSLEQFTPRTGELNDVIMHQRSIDAITADMTNNIVYWSDKSQKKIYRSLIPTNKAHLGIPQDLQIPDLDTVEDLAYDWMGNNIFFIDSARHFIGVTKANWTYVKTLQKFRSGNEMKSLVVNSELGLMFWSEYANDGASGTIRVANMSGFGSPVKILSAGLAMPSTLAIDYYMGGRLYWIDRQKKTIESANFDGSDYVIINSHVGHRPYSVDVVENRLFYTTQSNRNINIMDKFGRGISNRSDTVYTAKLPINNIFVLSQQKYPMDAAANRCLNMECEGLCLPEPGGARCVCPDNWRIVAGKCVRPDTFKELPAPKMCSCQNGGICIMYPVQSCHCKAGFTGRYCELTAVTRKPTTVEPSPTEAPVAPKTEAPVAPKTEGPVAPTTEEPVAPTTEEPVAPKTEEPVAPTTEEPVAPTTEEPVASGPTPIASPQSTSSHLIAAIVAPVIISVIIIGLVGLVIYWLHTRGSIRKMMSGHGEVRAGRPGTNGSIEIATPREDLTAEAAPYDHGTPVQREINFWDWAVRFSNPLYDTAKKRSDDRAASGASSPPPSGQDINTNYVYRPADIQVAEKSEPPSIAEAVSGLAEVKLDLHANPE